MADAKYWLWLSGIAGVGSSAQAKVLRYFGDPEPAYLADSGEYARIEGLKSPDIKRLSDKSLDWAEQTLEACYLKGIRIVTVGGAEYPARLAGIDNPPVVLYVRGLMLPGSDQVVVAVVGAREATAYGLMAARKIGYQIGSCGGVVVSGIAKGVDAKGIEGALTAGAPAVAVLGCGADVVYPKENRALFEDVAVAGSIVSEYAPGTEPLASNFPIRNRIISGISVGVVVVEAGEKSGSLITASHALEQGRDVFAVPGNIDAESSSGANALIRDGAVLVTSGWDVVREYADQYPGKISFRNAPRSAYEGSPERPDTDGEPVQKVASPFTKYEKDDKKVIDKSARKAYIDLNEAIKDLNEDERAVAQCLKDKKRHVDDIIDLTQIPAPRVLAALTLLEVSGLVSRLPGNRFSLTGQ